VKRGRISESVTHWASIVTHKFEKGIRAGDRIAPMHFYRFTQNKKCNRASPAKDKEQRNITCLRKTQTRLFA